MEKKSKKNLSIGVKQNKTTPLQKCLENILSIKSSDKMEFYHVAYFFQTNFI